jgi:hypothetical protein
VAVNNNRSKQLSVRLAWEVEVGKQNRPNFNIKNLEVKYPLKLKRRSFGEEGTVCVSNRINR